MGGTTRLTWRCSRIFCFRFSFLVVCGFPNLFLLTGPQSPGVKSQMILSIEQHVNWIAKCIGEMNASSKKTIDALSTAEKEWVNHVQEVANKTLYSKGNSWYQGVNIPGKAKVFMPYVGGVERYNDICNKIQKENYKGFRII